MCSVGIWVLVPSAFSLYLPRLTLSAPSITVPVSPGISTALLIGPPASPNRRNRFLLEYIGGPKVSQAAICCLQCFTDNPQMPPITLGMTAGGRSLNYGLVPVSTLVLGHPSMKIGIRKDVPTSPIAPQVVFRARSGGNISSLKPKTWLNSSQTPADPLPFWEALEWHDLPHLPHIVIRRDH